MLGEEATIDAPGSRIVDIGVTGVNCECPEAVEGRWVSRGAGDDFVVKDDVRETAPDPLLIPIALVPGLVVPELCETSGGSDTGNEKMLEGSISLSRSDCNVDVDIDLCRSGGSDMVDGNGLMMEISSSPASTLAKSSGDMMAWGV